MDSRVLPVGTAKIVAQLARQRFEVGVFVDWLVAHASNSAPTGR
jgi:hypothetical protein